ncbi:MAG TPA: PhzF family phenazine biosynthesis protein [Acidobacteriaceae bacterium]
MKTLGYSVVDVFAERPLEGNPLAVFHDGRGLSSDEMQAIARETNLSETTFVLPSDSPEEDKAQGVRVRIFTTEEELPFAGHPTLGTASWLHLHHSALRGASDLTLRLNVGPIPVSFANSADADETQSVFATMQQNDPVFGEQFGTEEIASVIGMEHDDLLQGFAPQSVSTGNVFCIVALRDTATLERLAIPQREANPWLKARGIRWFYCIAPQDAAALHDGRWHARMQFYSGEDPATGSAAGPCAAWLVKHRLLSSGEPATILQGVEIKRPSRITVEAKLDGERVHAVRVSGRTISVANGSFFLR